MTRGSSTVSGGEWRETLVCSDYIVSSFGEVRHKRVNAPILKGDTDPKGYRRVAIMGKHCRVARLVCGAFHGPCPEGHECGHLDGDKNNNAATNLVWITRSENTKQSIQHGTHRLKRAPSEAMSRGDDHCWAKVREADVMNYRRRHAQGESGRKLAVEAGISSANMSRLLRGDTWAHVPTGDAPETPHLTPGESR